MSQTGREILIKAVAKHLPTYTMTCFKLPLTLCNEIESLIRKFFWGQQGDNRKIHWVKWSDLCKPKLQGGMGFKDLAMFNDALLAKQTWKLLHDTQSLLYKVFKANFFPTTIVMEARTLSNASYTWKSIIKAPLGRREWNGMERNKRIILEYSSLLLFGNFNGGNGKLIPLFGSLSGREWNE